VVCVARLNLGRQEGASVVRFELARATGLVPAPQERIDIDGVFSSLASLSVDSYSSSRGSNDGENRLLVAGIIIIISARTSYARSTFNFQIFMSRAFRSSHFSHGRVSFNGRPAMLCDAVMIGTRRVLPPQHSLL
jgi:hypothetical protein